MSNGKDLSNHLDPREREMILEEIRRRRTPGTYAEGKWSVSTLNRSPNVLAARMPDSYPTHVTIRDITLRTIEQTPNVVVTKAQRRRLAEALVEAGVRSVQVAWLSTPNAWSDLADDVRALKHLKADIEVCGIGGSRDQADRAIDAGIDTFHVYGPSIPAFHPIYGPYGRLILRAHWRGENWRETVRYPKNEDEHLAMFQEEVSYVKSKGVRVGALTSMLHYATPEYLARFAKAVHEVGVDEIGLGDGASGLGPEAWAYIVGIVRESAPGVSVVLHTHNAFGMVVASTLAGIHAGAEIPEVSVNGLCSAAGQADLAEIVASLEIIYGVDTGIDMSKLTPLRTLVEDITGVVMAPNKAVTGAHAWTYTEEGMREETAYAPVHKAAEPEVFGNRARYLLGPHSGTWSLRSKLDEAGVQVDEDLIPAILAAIHAEMSVRMRALEDDEIAAIAERYHATPTA